jgi:glycosyltransferase involved in cell wall biosynthesis
MIDKKIVIDVRMINISGIGRYIQSMIPTIISKFQHLVLIGNPEELVKFDWFNKVEVISLLEPIYSIKEQFSLRSLTPKCDIFFSPHYNVPLFLPQAKKKAVIIPDVNHLVFQEGLSYLKKIYAKFFYFRASKQDLVFTISEFSKKEISRFTGCDEKKIIVAKCAIDKEYFNNLIELNSKREIPDELKKYSNEKFILYVGNIKPHKNLKRSLFAFEQLLKKDGNIKFVMVGKRDNFLTKDVEIFNIVENNPVLKKAVEFTGKIDDLDLAYIYSKAELLLFVSLYEGFGLPPLEAMYFGCPVISSKFGSLPEICGDAALYCDALNVDDIEAKISELLVNDQLKAKILTNGRNKVNEYDWGKFNRTIVENLELLT